MINDSSKMKALRNCAETLKIMWKYSSKYLVFSGFLKMFSYCEWIFFSAFFLRYIIESLEHDASLSSLFLFVSVVGLVEALIALFNSYVNMRLMPVESVLISDRLNDEIIKKARQVDLKCFDDSDFYNKYTLAMEGADQKLMSIVQNIWGCIFGACATIISFVIMYRIDRVVGAFVLFPLIGNFVVGNVVNKLVYTRNKELSVFRRKISYINRVFYMREYAKEIRLSNVYRLLQKKYREAMDGIRCVTRKHTMKGVLLHWIKSILTFSVIFEGTILYGAYKTLVVHSMDLSELAIISSMMVSATWILIGFADSTTECIKDSFFINNYFEFINYSPDISDDHDGLSPSETIESIEFRNVTFSYNGVKALNDVSFTMSRNHVYALVGNNGAGKTTIIKLLLRFYDPDSGTILVNGIDIRKYNLREYRDLFETAFQEQVLLPVSITDFVKMGADASDEEVDKVLQAVGLSEKIANYVNKESTVLTKEFDDDGVLLSGGEIQRLSVARALVSKADIKIYDEPSSALDPIAEEEIYQSIVSDGNSGLILFISHRLSSVKTCDCVFLMENGEIIESGTHDALIQLNGKYAKMYNIQAQNYLALSDSGVC